MNTINIRPTTGVLGTYRRLSYTLWYAISEFVDNSTASYYEHRQELLDFYDQNYKLQIDINYFSKEKKLVISDNAYGMEYADFERAIVLDRPPFNSNGRNEFGMGLKTAASWFGDKWKVETTKLGSRKKYSATIDINDLVKNRTEEIDYNVEPALEFEHYTVITIWNIEHAIKGKAVSRIKKELQSIYRRDLCSGDIEIQWRKEKLKYVEPKLRNDVNDSQIRQEVSFAVYNDLKKDYLPVKGWVGVLDTGNRQNAGLTLFRRNRVIQGGPGRNYRPAEIFGDSGSFKYQRVIGELDMDNWPVSQAKDAIDWYGDLEDNFIQKLKTEIENILNYAQRARYKKTERPPLDLSDETKTKIGEALKESFEDISDKYDSNEGSYKTDVSNYKKVSEDFNPISSFKLGAYDYKVDWTDDKQSNWLQVSTLENIKYLTINVNHPFFIPFNENSNFLELISGLVVSLLHSIEIVKSSNSDVDYIRIHMNQLLNRLSSKEVF